MDESAPGPDLDQLWRRARECPQQMMQAQIHRHPRRWDAVTRTREDIVARRLLVDVLGTAIYAQAATTARAGTPIRTRSHLDQIADASALTARPPACVALAEMMVSKQISVLSAMPRSSSPTVGKTVLAVTCSPGYPWWVMERVVGETSRIR